MGIDFSDNHGCAKCTAQLVAHWLSTTLALVNFLHKPWLTRNGKSVELRRPGQL